jgi:hypothetical protein
MKRASILSVSALLVLAMGCAVAIDDQEPLPEETIEQSQQLDGVEQVEEQPSTASSPELPAPDLSGESSELEEGSRPDPDPWMSGDPLRPDPDPWSPPTSDTED